VAGSGGGHGAGDGERVDAGVAGVELDGLGLFGLAAGAGAADDDGDVVFVVVIEEAALLYGLTGGDYGEVGGAVGRGEDAGGEVVSWVKVFDGCGLGEAEALGGTGCLWVGREWGDAGGADEEGAAEVFDGIADGGDAAQSCNDDTVHTFSDAGLGGGDGGFRGYEFLDAIDHVAYGFDGAEGLVRDFDAEGFLDLE
jgi:hypothetical protein